jgi:hypothetical protein
MTRLLAFSLWTVMALGCGTATPSVPDPPPVVDQTKQLKDGTVVRTSSIADR